MSNTIITTGKKIKKGEKISCQIGMAAFVEKEATEEGIQINSKYPRSSVFITKSQIEEIFDCKIVPKNRK